MPTSDDTLKQILAGQERIEEKLSDVQKDVARLSERTTSLEAWRSSTEVNTKRFWDQTWVAAQRLQEAHEDRLRELERHHATKDSLAKVEERLRLQEQTATTHKAWFLVIGAAAGFAGTLIAKLIHVVS